MPPKMQRSISSNINNAFQDIDNEPTIRNSIVKAKI